jgi:Domain of unknown function (DUF4351)
MNNVVDTARQEGVEEGIERGIELERARIIDRQRAVTLGFLGRSLGDIPKDIQAQVNQLPIAQLERLQETLLNFTDIDDLVAWFSERS